MSTLLMPQNAPAAREFGRCAILSTSDLIAGYGTHTVLHGIDLNVYQGEIVALMGESGCGKSTLLRVLAGLSSPISGQIKRMYASDQVAMMFQTPLLQPWLTVAGNIELPCKIAHRDCDVDRLLHTVGLDNCNNLYPWQLSGGMQRRVALARALAQDPTLLILDEPFTGADEFTQEKLHDLLNELVAQSGISCLLTTHNPFEAIFLADQVAIMAGKPARITHVHPVNLARPRNESTRQSHAFIREVASLRQLFSRSRYRLDDKTEENYEDLCH